MNDATPNGARFLRFETGTLRLDMDVASLAGGQEYCFTRDLRTPPVFNPDGREHT